MGRCTAFIVETDYLDVVCLQEDLLPQINSISLNTLEVKMTLTGLLILLLVAGIVGALGQSVSGYSFGGCLTSILIGFIGAYIGVWLASQFGLPEIFSITVEGQAFPVLWSIIGAALLSVILGLFLYRRPVV